MSLVHIYKTSTPSGIKNYLNDLNLFIDNDQVLIKPNIVAPANAKTGIVMDPELVSGVIHYLKEEGIKNIIIEEAPGLEVDVNKAFEISGFDKLKNIKGVSLVDLNSAEMELIEWKFGHIKVPKLALNSYYINIPKLKTHMNTTVTLSLKNQKGLLHPSDKKRFHMLGLHVPIATLAEVIKPNLTIIDGIIDIEGDGPLFSGKPIQSNVIIISNDVVAADATGCRIMGVYPFTVKHIKLAYEANVGDINPDVVGDSIAETQMSFKRANEKYFKFLKLTNWRNPYACTMCGDILRMAIERIKKSPKLWFKYCPKLAYHLFVKGIDFLQGKNSRIPEKHGKVICIGDCTKEKTDKKGFVWVKGCPPSPDDLLKKL